MITETQTNKHLVVTLHNEGYAIPVRDVREIIRWTKITRVPQMPPHVSGVINLRGRVIPILDLRTRFGFTPEVGVRTCIVVVEVANSKGPAVIIGLVVDSVEEVAAIGQNEMEPPPDVGMNVDTRYLRGIAKTKGRVVMILDTMHVVAGIASTAEADAAA